MFKDIFNKMGTAGQVFCLALTGAMLSLLLRAQLAAASNHNDPIQVRCDWANNFRSTVNYFTGNAVGLSGFAPEIIVLLVAVLAAGAALFAWRIVVIRAALLIFVAALVLAAAPGILASAGINKCG